MKPRKRDHSSSSAQNKTQKEDEEKARKRQRMLQAAVNRHRIQPDTNMVFVAQPPSTSLINTNHATSDKQVTMQISVKGKHFEYYKHPLSSKQSVASKLTLNMSDYKSAVRPGDAHLLFTNAVLTASSPVTVLRMCSNDIIEEFGQQNKPRFQIVQPKAPIKIFFRLYNKSVIDYKRFTDYRQSLIKEALLLIEDLWHTELDENHDVLVLSASHLFHPVVYDELIVFDFMVSDSDILFDFAVRLLIQMFHKKLHSKEIFQFQFTDLGAYSSYSSVPVLSLLIKEGHKKLDRGTNTCMEISSMTEEFNRTVTQSVVHYFDEERVVIYSSVLNEDALKYNKEKLLLFHRIKMNEACRPLVLRSLDNYIDIAKVFNEISNWVNNSKGKTNRPPTVKQADVCPDKRQLSVTLERGNCFVSNRTHQNTFVQVITFSYQQTVMVVNCNRCKQSKNLAFPEQQHLDTFKDLINEYTF